MKQVIFSIGIIFSFLTISAQTTNTFPLDGSAGIGTVLPSSYYHGGNNKVLEIYNPNTTLNSQAHIILTTGSTSNNSGAGSVSWVSKNSTGFQGMAYIACSMEGDAANNAMGRLVFATSNGTSAPIVKMTINKDGNVAIGTDNPQGYKLAVAGSMIAESVKVKLQGTWPDFVFAKNYVLPTLQETEKHIKEKGHLPGIPSAAEVEKNGIELGDMNKKLLQKIEELTLYLIEQEKKLETQSDIIKRLVEKSNNTSKTYENK
jgi:hypothetical protein